MPEKLNILEISSNAQVKVNKDNGTISDVVLLSEWSKNKRHYGEEAQRRARHLFDGARVFDNHSPGTEKIPRSFKEMIGRIRNPRVVSENGIFKTKGDLEVLRSESKFLIIAEQMPETVAMSINAAGMGVSKKNFMEVLDIHKVKSVDVVTSPGATISLFEGAPQENEFREEEMEIGSLTLEQLEKDRIDLVEALTAKIKSSLEDETKKKEAKNEDLGEVAQLKEQLGKLQSKLEEKDQAEKLRMQIEEAIAASELSEQALTESFRKILLAQPSLVTVKALLEDRKVAFEGMPSGKKPRSREQAPLRESKGSGNTGKDKIQEARSALQEAIIE